MRSDWAAVARICGSFARSIAINVRRTRSSDLAASALPNVRAPTLLIVGGHDPAVLDLNREAYAKLTCEKNLTVVEGATHLFEEPGAMARVSGLALRWFRLWLPEGSPGLAPPV